MTLYEIDKRIIELLDPETGELLDYEAFEQLSMEREQKIESAALWIKEMAAEAAAIKHEETTLAERRKALERRTDSLKRYLALATGGEKFSTPRCVVSFRKTQRIVPSDGFVQWAMQNGRDDLLKYAEPTVSLTAVKAALAAGEDVPAKIEYSVSVGVK